jgi:hypothetical protein
MLYEAIGNDVITELEDVETLQDVAAVAQYRNRLDAWEEQDTPS